MFSYKFYIREEKNDSLMLRITNNRKKAEMSMGLRMTQSELDAALSGVSGSIRFEKMLASWTMQIKDLMLELSDRKESDKNAKEIRAILQERLLGQPNQPAEQPIVITGNFKPYFASFVDKKINNRTKEIYQATFSRMTAYDPDFDKKNFEDITIRWLTDFDAFLSKTSPSQNARNIHFRNIRTVINAAIDDGLTTHYPFRRFKIRPVPTKKRSLSVENIQKIFNAKGLEDWEIKYWDFFKLSFMLIGINVVDLCNLTEIVDGRIEYDRAKTHKPYSIKVEPEAMELIEKYKGEKHLLNFTDNYANYRHFYNNLCKGLSSIRDKLDLKSLTSYWARHTWATIAYNDCNISKDVIAQALGHGSGSVTDIYLDKSQNLVDDANRKVLDWVLYGKR